MNPRPPAPTWAVLLALATVYLVWGSIYLAIRVALESWPPFLMAALRFWIAGLLMLAWARARGEPWPQAPGQWFSAGGVGLLMLAGANGGVTWAEQFVESGVAAVLIATVPLWMIALEALRPGGDRPRPSAVAGLALGLVGVAVLMRPNFSVAGDPQVLFGEFVLLGAALLWALGSIAARQLVLPRGHAMSAALQMLSGGAALSALAVVGGEWSRWPRALELWPALAFAYLVVFGSLLAYSAYQWLLQVTRPALVATYAYVNPVVAVFLGTWLAGERFTPAIGVGSALVILSAFLIQRVRRSVSTGSP